MDQLDGAVVARVLDGDQSAFEILVRRHRRAAYAVALAQTRQPADAEDVCQDAFVLGFRKLASCRSPERFRIWLLQIVRNVAHNHRRYHRRRPTTSFDAVRPPTSSDTPIANLERRELRDRLTRALALVSPTQREVVLLSCLEDWSHAEIAEALGISVAMSRRHLSDARRKLQLILGDTTESEETHD